MFYIAFAGGSGSGKSSILHDMAALRPEERISILPMDAYYKDHSHLSLQEKKVCNFDDPQAIDFDLFINHLECLRNGMSVHRPIYSFVTCSRLQETEVVYPSDFLFIEGLFALINERIRKIVDFSVYLDCPSDIRKERIVQRDMTERGRSREETESRFVSMVKPMHQLYIEPSSKYADLVVDTSLHNIPSLALTIWDAIDMRINKPDRLRHVPLSRK
jgi:uridine kinase